MRNHSLLCCVHRSWLPFAMGVTTSRAGGTVKTLVLGCMAAGKSTFMKQMLRIHGKNGMTLRRDCYAFGLQLHLIKIFQELRKVCDSLEIDISQYEHEFKDVTEYKHRDEFKGTIVASITTLKNSGLFEACKRKQRIIPLPMNYNYIISRSDEILTMTFVPNETDILMAYAETVGINTETVCCQGINFELIEMPGHHIWRPRWNEFFADTELIVFVIDLAELCDPAFYRGHLENKTVTVFTELVANPVLSSVFWMLLFNKVDTFNDHSAGFDFKKLASHLDTAESARTFYRGQFATVVPRDRSFTHMVSLVNNRDSQSVISDLFRRVGKAYRDRQQTM